MKRHLHVLFIIAVMALGFLNGTSADGKGMIMQNEGYAVSAGQLNECIADSNADDQSACYLDGSSKEDHGFIEDPQNSYRITCSRPQRTVSCNGNKAGKIMSKSFSNDYLEQSVNSQFCNWTVLEPAPFQSEASRYYYVIALRHIIR